MPRLKILRLDKVDRVDSMLPSEPVLHVVIQAQKRHQASTACWRRQTDERWQSLLNRQISASLLSLHQMQWSTRRGGVLDGERSSYKAKWSRPYPGRRGAGRWGGSRPGFRLQPARGTVLRVFIWCPLLFRVCTYLSARAVTPRASSITMFVVRKL